MKTALISPNEQIQYISSWALIGNVYEPVYSVAGQRVAEVAQNTFPVAPPLFWIECADEVTAEQYCYNNGACTVIPPDAPQPQPNPDQQPTVEGAQSL